MAKKRHLMWMVGAGGSLLTLLAFFLISPAACQVLPPGGQSDVLKVLPADGLAQLKKVKAQPDVPKQDPPVAPSGKKGAHYGAINLNQNPTYGDYLNAARDCIKDKQWGDAAQTMNAILKNSEDYFVKVADEDPKTHVVSERWTSVKYEANRLLGSMPLEGLKKYEEIYGRAAEIEVEDAIKTQNVQKLAQAAQQYFHTKAGIQANDMLATYFLDQGQFFQAALQFDRVLTLSSKQANIPPLTLLKASIAYRRIGDNKRSEELFNQLKAAVQIDGGLKIGKQMVALNQITAMLNVIPKAQTINPKDWTLIRGDLTNTAQTIGSQPLLGDISWHRPTVRDKLVVPNPPGPPIELEADPDGGVPELIKEARQKISAMQGVPVMSGFFPLAVEGKLLYRTYSGMTAVYLQDQKDDDGKVVNKAGDIAWKGLGFDGGLAKTLSNLKLGKFAEFVQNFRQNHPDFMNFVYENSLVGTLSADLKHAYAVDDAGIPVPPNMLQQLFGNPNIGFQPNPIMIPWDVKHRLLQNSLQAYDLKSGNLQWRLVGSQYFPPAAGGGVGEWKVVNPQLENSYFLGPPLPVGGKLYVLNEKAEGKLRLLVINPAKPGTIIGEQELGDVDEHSRFVQDPNRRVHAVHLAYGEGILVCPTNCGEVLGIDLLHKSLAWAYPYREGKMPAPPPVVGPGFPPPNQPMPLLPATWKVTPPAVAEGKVVFTAPDAKSLHCINLRDGTLLWKKERTGSDLFLAGVWDGKVIIVGKNICYARDLAKGNLLWEVTLSDSPGTLPSGQGVASKGIYYLPLSNGEVCAININQGSLTRNRPSSGAQPLGNLVFHEGTVVSQTLDEIVAYPQLTAKLEVVENEFKKSPNDLTKMFELSELKLDNGEVLPAVKMLYELKSKNPPAELQTKVQSRLYQALTDLFQIDFKTAYNDKTFRTDYENMCREPGPDSEKRQGNYYRLLGAGLEEMEDLVGAFEAYKKFGSLPLYLQQGIPAKDDPLRKIPAQVWLRGRLSAMIAKFGDQPAKLAQLRDKIKQDWTKDSATGDIDKIRSFVTMFDATFDVGQQARLKLANAIIDRGAAKDFLEAEMSLEQLRSHTIKNDAKKALINVPQTGGAALDALARLEKKRGAIKQSAEYYRQLLVHFPKDEIRDGKTGKDLADEAFTEKPFLPYLEPASALWGNGKFKVRETGGDYSVGSSVMLLPKGELNPAGAQLRLVLEPLVNSPRIKLVDLVNNKDIWGENLNPQETQSQVAFKLFFQGMFPKSYSRYAMTKGHLAVVQVGTMAYAIDLSKREQPILWKHSLMNEPIPPGTQPQASMASLDEHGHMLLTFKSFNFQQKITTVRVGYVAAVQPSYVALVDQENLIVIDPLSDKTAKVLWTRGNIGEDTEIFGDDQYIYLVDVNGGVASNGRALRATDGSPVSVPDFAAVYQKRLHQNGSQILCEMEENGKRVLRLYDLPTGTDLWKGTYHIDTVVLRTVDPYLTGVIEPDGKMSVVDLKSLKVVMQSNVVHNRVTKADVKELSKPLLLADRDNFYVALNQKINDQVIAGGQLLSNFENQLRCEVVNGWVGAFYRHDGSKKINGQVKAWKTGDLNWYSSEPVEHQLVVVENFETMPLIVFTVRYTEKLQGPGLPKSYAKTQTLDRSTGKWIYYPPTPYQQDNPGPKFRFMSVDPASGLVSMVGNNYGLHHYVDDGRPIALLPNNPFKAPPPPNFGPFVPQPAVAKVQQMVAKLGGLPAGNTYKMTLPGVPGITTLQTGNPMTITLPGQQPVSVQDWLNYQSQPH